MTDVEIRSRAEVRETVQRAIADQWDRDTEQRIERSPQGHQDALTDAVMAAIPSGIDVRIHG